MQPTLVCWGISNGVFRWIATGGLGYPKYIYLIVQYMRWWKYIYITTEDCWIPFAITQDAIKEREFFWEEGTESGDVNEVLSQAPHVLEGQVRVGGQEHFYLEPQSSLVVPLEEHDEILVYSSTQVYQMKGHKGSILHRGIDSSDGLGYRWWSIWNRLSNYGYENVNEDC